PAPFPPGRRRTFCPHRRTAFETCAAVFGKRKRTNGIRLIVQRSAGRHTLTVGAAAAGGDAADEHNERPARRQLPSARLPPRGSPRTTGSGGRTSRGRCSGNRVAH